MTARAERAGYLPGLDPDALPWEPRRYGPTGEGGVTALLPKLDVAAVETVAAHVRQAARRGIKTWPTGRIVDALDAAAARLLDRAYPMRRKMDALLPVVTGYDAEMTRLGLTGYLKTFRKPQLLRFLAEDFANPGILDGFQPLAKGGLGRAYGPDLLAHVWAGNVPGLPLWSLAAGLLVKAGNVGKAPTAEPFFAGWFAQVLAEVEPELADGLAILWWQGGDAALEGALLRQADVALGFGGDQAIGALQAQAPTTTRFLAYGHKVSFGLIGREALDPTRAAAAARRAAYDVARYDQQGCYSPHTFFVERGGAVGPAQFGRYLAQALAGYEKKFPRRPLALGEAAAVGEWRLAEEMRAGGEVIGAPDGAWTVSMQTEDVAFRPSGLNRSIRVVALDALEDVLAVVAPYKTLLQTVAIAASPERLFDLSGALGEIGVNRVTALGDMTAPEAGWHHDGRFNLLDLVRITEIDARAETAAEDLATYAD